MTVRNQLTQKEILSLAQILIGFTSVDEIIIDDIEIRVRGRKGDSGTCGEAIYRTKDTSLILADCIAKCIASDKALKSRSETANEKIALLDAYEKKVKNRK